MTLADGNDAARAFKVSFGHIAIDGGAGNDTISDAPQSGANVDGGFGDDRIVSQNRTSTISGGFGRDFIDDHDEGHTIDCGAGLDRYVQYAGDTVSNCEVPQA